jgi:hypothetical protein
VAELQLADKEQEEEALTVVRTAWGISGAVKSSECWIYESAGGVGVEKTTE